MFSLFGDYRKKMQEDKKKEKQGDGLLILVHEVFSNPFISSRSASLFIRGS